VRAIKPIGNALMVLVGAAVCTAPLLLHGLPNTASDLHITLTARTLSGILFWQHGLYGRVPELLSGIEPWSSGLYSLKLDSLVMNLATSSAAMVVVLLVRSVVFITVLSIVFSLRYGAPFLLCVALACCAAVGLNLLAWLYYSPDYFGGGIFGWGYALFPVLLLPLALERSIHRLVVLAALSFAVGVLYGMTATYAIAVFGSFAAAVWIVIEVASVRGLVVAAANAVGAALALAPELVRFVTVGTEGARSKFALFFDSTQTAQILIHRDGRTGFVALALVLLALVTASLHRKDRVVLVKLSAIYLVLMLIDPLMKAAGRSLEPVVPVIVLSTSYYSYVFAPIVVAAFVCIGFRHLAGIKMKLLSAVLLLIALKLTSGSATEFAVRESSNLSIVAEVAGELTRPGASRGRAVVIRPIETDLQTSNFRLPLLSPNEFAMFGLDMADGYLPNPSNAYSLFMSNVMTTGPDPTTNSKFERSVILNVPVLAHFAEAGQGCLEQRSAIPLDEHLSLPVLQNAAVGYVISMFSLESKYLRLKTSGAPVFCPKGRGEGRPFVYEFTETASRFGLARDVSIAGDIEEAYRALHADAEFAQGDRVVMTRDEAAKLNGAVSGIADESGTVRLLADDGDRLRFAASSPKDTLLIVRDAFSQPVSAADEKGALDVVRINGAFIGIRVRSGESRVTMAFN
jgi:hypothetical protein